MRENAKVLRVESGGAVVDLGMRPECAGCKSSLCKINTAVVIKTDLNLKTGDEVMVEIPDSNAVIAPVVLYLLPMLFFIGGVVVGGLLNDYMRLVFGLLFLLPAFCILYFIDKALRRAKGHRIEIISVVSQG